MGWIFVGSTLKVVDPSYVQKIMESVCARYIICSNDRLVDNFELLEIYIYHVETMEKVHVCIYASCLFICVELIRV